MLQIIGEYYGAAWGSFMTSSSA